jgi:hypothetical protein
VIASDLLADRMRAATIVQERNGPVTWERVEAWELPGRMPARGERGGGLVDAETDERIDDRREDAAAARYKPELAALTKRLEADLARLTRIHQICNPEPAKSLATRDMQVAQVEADGWCGHCWSDDQFLEPIALRPSVAPIPSRPYYRGLCRWCGSFKREHGTLPPIALLRKHHGSKPITEADVEKALGKVNA